VRGALQRGLPPRRHIPLLLLAGIALVFVPFGGAAAGRLDPAFDRDGKVVTDFGGSEFSEDLAIQPDGKIVVVGWNDATAETPAFLLARYNLNGSLDSGFGSGGKVRTNFGFGSAVAIQSDGRVVAAGQAQVDGTFNFALARYNRDGTLDPSFDRDGKLTTDFGFSSYATGVAIQPDGKIVAVGSARTAPAFAGGEFAAARYLPNGALDPTFDRDGRVLTPFTSASDAAQDVALQADGKLVAGGFAGWLTPSFATPPDFALARYNADGSLDATFDGDGKLTTALDRAWRSFGHDIAIQPDGKILLGGGAIVRYNANGSLDPSFGASGKLLITETGVSALAVQRDRKILAIGTSRTALDNFSVTRLHRDGRVDVGFALGGHVVTDFGSNSTDGALAAALQRDGKLVAVGITAPTSQGPVDFALARYLGDPPPAKCVVPNVRGKTLRVARSRIARARCAVGQVTSKSSQRVERGRVLSQSPRAGSRLGKGGKVNLVVSLGRR
jgi:uncharacterized delta-60 repeat protein